MDKCGTRLVYLADEFYIKAGSELPSYEAYEDFPQIENGVGLMTLLIYEFNEYLKRHAKKLNNYWSKNGGNRAVSIATGKCASMYIKQLAQMLEKRYNGLKIRVYPIENCFFGENVTVTGLLTGGDIASQLAGKELGSELLLSRSMFKSGEELFLDDVTLDGLRGRLGTEITITENEGGDLIEKILGAR